MVERKIINNDCLVLNSDGAPLSFLPISTCTWREAITEEYLGNVIVLHHHEDWVVRSANKEFKVPSVIMTKQWARKGRNVKYSRNQVFLRDGYTCQYCGNPFQKHNLTLDHWKPKKDGGESSWENIVTACKSCNGEKGHKYGWTPLTIPKKPSYGELTAAMKKLPIMIRDPNWNLYLGWDERLVSLLPGKVDLR